MNIFAVTEAANEQFLTNLSAGSGIVTTPDGMSYWRIRVDNSGVLVSELVSPPLNPLLDFVWNSKKKGPLFNPGGISDVGSIIYRIRADFDGTILSEAITLDGWQVSRPINAGDYFAGDVLVYGPLQGVVLTTPDGLSMYRIRVDTDGVPISEQVL